MNKYVITITRQFGSLGRQIGKKVAENLGIAYYDRDIIEQASRILGENINELGQYDNKPTGYERMAYPLGYGDLKLQNKLFEAEKSVVLEHARYESCVIVGRCADYILKDHKNVISVFIYAPYQDRINNCILELRLSNGDAVKYIEKVDKARANFYKKVAGTEFQDIQNRDLMINSSLLKTDGTADLICQVAKCFELKLSQYPYTLWKTDTN